MIKGIEEFSPSLQKAILECIAHNFDMSEDVDVVETDENVIEINDVKYLVIDDADQRSKITRFNADKFDDFFEDLNKEQISYIDEDKWIVDYGIETFKEWIEECTDYTVDDCDYYGKYNFYEVH